MKAPKIGIISAIIASLCCIGPLLLVLLGLGSLGIGAATGKYHWYFISVALALLIIAWRGYLKEKKTCSLKGCRMENKRMIPVTLMISTLVVAVFAGLNIYTYALQKDFSQEISKLGLIETKATIIPVEGMTCFTCEIAVSSALKNIDGVIAANASAKEGKAYVKYGSSKTNIRQLIDAINKTGYKASLPE